MSVKAGVMDDTISLRNREDILSGPVALRDLRTWRSFITPFLPTWMLRSSGVLVVPRSGSGEPSSVNIDENWLLRTSGFPPTSSTVLSSFFGNATPKMSHFFVLEKWVQLLLVASLVDHDVDIVVIPSCRSSEDSWSAPSLCHRWYTLLSCKLFSSYLTIVRVILYGYNRINYVWLMCTWKGHASGVLPCTFSWKWPTSVNWGCCTKLCCEGSGKSCYILLHVSQVGFLSEVDESKRVGTLLSPGIGVYLFTRLGQLVTKMSRILSLCVGKSTISSAPKK